MKQVLCCLLLTISAGTCSGYGVKGSFSKSYSSSSASASSSAFSSSFSSGDDANLNEVTKSLKAGAHAGAAAFAQAGAGEAKSGSGAFAGVDAGSGSSFNSGFQTTPDVHTTGHGSHSNSASGSYSGTGSTCSTCSGSAAGASNVRGDSELINVIGNGYSSTKQNTKFNTINNAGSGTDSGAANNVFVNDFGISNENSNSNNLITGFKSNNNNGANSEDYKGCCKGPFPGPKGSISDFKPAPPGGGGPPAWTPEEQQPTATDTGTIGISSQLIHSFPGSHGGIHDSKPAFDKPYHGGNIPVSVIPVLVETPQTHVPGNIIGTLPGPTGSIHTSIPAGQHPKPATQIPVQPSTNYGNEKPGLSLDLIHSFPGKPGSIHDNKIVPSSPCIGVQCKSNGNQNYNAGSGNYRPESYQPKIPDCTTGQCDEYGGKLACHGNDCFGPGKKPSNAHFSTANSNANSNAKHETGSININLSEPSTGTTYQQGLCKSGNCNGKPIDCTNGQCGGFSQQKPEHETIIVDVTPINVPSGSQQNIYPSPGNINFGVNYPVPSSPGIICSGVECLLPGTKKSPNSSATGCSGAYCITPTPSCSGGNCNKNIHESNSNVQQNQEKDDSTYTIEAELPSSPEQKQPITTNKPYDQGPGFSQDFLLPGNKPYHRHIVKPHQPTMPKKPTGEGYYTCTGTSCPLPKHPGQITSQPTQPQPDKLIPSPGQQSCTGNDCTPQLKPFKVPDEYKGAGGHDRLYPNYNQEETPQLKPFKIPNEYKVNEYQDQNEESPLVIPVIVGGEPQISGNKPVSHYSGNNGFVAGQVTVQKSEGIEIPVVDVLIPGSIKPEYSCSGGECDESKLTTNDGFVQGTNSEVYSGSSGAHVQGSGCFGGLCKIPISGASANGCTSGKCGFNGGISGSQADSVSENLQDNFKGGCTGGKCGTNLNGGIHSGTGNYGGGCTSGKCGANGGVSGSQAGSSNGNLQGYLHGNGGVSGSQTGSSNGNLQGYLHGNGGVSGSQTGSSNGNLQGYQHGNEGVSGFQAGSSNGKVQGYVQGNGCSSGKCGTDYNGGSYSGSGSYGGGCTSGKCGSLEGLSGSQAGSFSKNEQGYVHGNGCIDGKCGTDAGSHSGSGSYSGLGSYDGAKGGCEGRPCGNNGAYSGAFSGSSSFGGSGSKAFSSSGSISTSNQGNGFGGFPFFKDLINQSIKAGNVHSGAGAFSGSSAYSEGGIGSHSSAYSSAGSFSVK